MRLTAIAIAFAFTASASAQQQARRPPVDIELAGIFGDELLVPNSHGTVLATLTNRSQERFQGTLRLQMNDWRNSIEEHLVRVDLPPSATRRVQVAMYVRESGAQLDAKYIQGRQELGSQVITVGFNGAQGIVVLSDPPRLRSVLLDLEADQSDPYGGTRRVGVPVGVVASDPDTGDPIAPTSAVGWGGVALLVAAVPDLERLTDTQKLALKDWIRAGGEVLAFPRTPEDLRAPFLTSLTGPLRTVNDVAMTGHHALVPAPAHGTGLAPEPGRGRAEAFGASVPHGFGRVFVATYDGASPPLVENPETRRVVVSILHRFRQPAIERAIFPFGGADDPVDQWGNNGRNFRPLRSVLDPNESFRPALGLVALVLLIYVFIVGPVNFSYVGKRNRPLLAMITTPLAAGACLMLLLLVGYIGKGTTMRYRAVSLLELQEAEDEGPERRYLGLFLTRPSTFDLPSVRRGVTRLLPAGASRLPRVDHDGLESELVNLQGGLWETLFVRQEEVRGLGGQVVFERSGGTLSAVRNETRETLHGAFILDAAGGVYPVGTIAPGARGAVAGSPAVNVGAENPTFWGENDGDLRQLANILQLEREDTGAIFGLVQAMGGTMVSGVPTLWAHVEVPARQEADLFFQESEFRFVRVTPRTEGTPVPVRWEDTGGFE